MRSLFRRTFLAFVLSLAVLLVVLVGSLVGGYYHSLETWSQRRMLMVQEAAEQILSGRAAGETQLPQDVPVFIYNQQGALVASNRGMGARREAGQFPRAQVRSGDTVVGHYEIGQPAFRNDAANRALTETLTRTAIAGVVVALGAALASAWFFARSLSRPAARVAEGIDSIASGAQAEPIPEQGAEEISRIARAANTLAVRLSSERDLRAQWAQDVTHDLRTPVASIRAQLEAIVDGVYQAEPGRITSTLAELGRVEQLIGDLDELMRLESPGVRLQGAPFTAVDFASTLRQRFQHEIDRKEIDLTVDLRCETISADEPLLDRAVSNLLANAIRHVVQGGRVRMTVQPVSGGGVEILVRNDGPPIPERELPHLFDRLFRGEYARSSPGSGLGLTIARRIVHLHGGSIGVTSTETDGTTVRIMLPQPAR